ncbi:MAG: hypothetical protein Q8N34_03410 [Gammaproteobacteria bacterium]|nr:hypothetical protein [Gammaproteobacteria bacterium]
MGDVVDLSKARKRQAQIAGVHEGMDYFCNEMVSLDPIDLLRLYDEYFGIQLNVGRVFIKEGSVEDIDNWGFIMTPGPNILSPNNLTHRACARFRSRYYKRVFDNFEGMIALFLQCIIEEWSKPTPRTTG